MIRLYLFVFLLTYRMHLILVAPRVYVHISSNGTNGIKEDNGTESDSGTSADKDEESILDDSSSDGDISKYQVKANENLEKGKQDVLPPTSSLPSRGDVFEQPEPLAAGSNGDDDHHSSSGRGSAVFHIPIENIPQVQPNSVVKMPEIRLPHKLPANCTLPAPPLPVPQMVLPCMRGTLTEDVENLRHVCSGIWGMSLADTDRGTTVRRGDCCFLCVLFAPRNKGWCTYIRICVPFFFWVHTPTKPRNLRAHLSLEERLSQMNHFHHVDCILGFSC